MTPLKKRWTAALALGLALLMTGCGGAGGNSSAPESEVKVNVFTSQNFQATGFVIQLADTDTVELAEDLVANLEESGQCPTETPDYILQFTPSEQEGGSDYWWLWTDPNGTATLVHKSESETAAYHATTVTSHQWGEMISDVTEGKGPV